MNQHRFFLLLALGSILLSTPLRAQIWHYPVPEGVKPGQWKGASAHWVQRARVAEIHRTDNTVVSGFLLGTYPEGMVVIQDQTFPFVSESEMKVTLVARDEIKKVNLQALGFQYQHPARYGLVSGAVLLPLWWVAMDDFVPSALLSAVSSALIAAPLISIPQLRQPFAQTYEVMGENVISWERLIRKLDRYNQVADLETAKRLPEYAPEHPEQVESWNSLHEVMPRVAKGFQPRRWAVYVGLAQQYYSATNIRDVVQDQDGYTFYGRPGITPEISFAYVLTPRFSLGIQYRQLGQFAGVSSFFNTDTTSTERLFAHVDITQHEWTLFSEYAIFKSDSYLQNRHQLLVGAGIGLIHGRDWKSISIRNENTDDRLWEVNSTSILRPNVQGRIVYEFAVTPKLSLRANVMAQTAGTVETEGISLQGQTEGLTIPGYSVDMTSVTAGLGATFRF